QRRPRRTARGRPPVPACPVDRRGRQRRRAAAAGRPPAARRRPGGGGCGWTDATVRSEEGFCSYPSHRRRGAADRHRAPARPGPGQILDTNSLMLAEQVREAGCEARVLPIEPDDPGRIAAVVREAAAGCDLLIVIAGSSSGRDDYTARVVASEGVLAVHGVAV